MEVLKRQQIQISIIVPVFNRPSEIEELLDSLTKQTNKNFEIIIVEDGSSIKCNKQIEKFNTLLKIRYLFKSNSGPGLSRNYGCENASGNYFIFLDSDCVVPPHYFQTIYDRLSNDYVDAFGGPDMATKSFSILQKSINYAMTSFLTTGGIRGGSEKLDKFFPRSFNMGYSKTVFNATKGFSNMRFGEDIDMSIRIMNAGFKTALVKQAYVFHKRRTNFRQFYKQVFNSGIARINLYKRHPSSLKLVHTFPSLFLLGIVLLITLSCLFSLYFFLPLILFTLLVFVDATFQNRDIRIGLFSILASYIQLLAYGAGFLGAFWNRVIFSSNEYSRFNETFYE